MIQVDVSKYEEVQRIRERIENEIGEVDILISNAGLLPEISLLEGVPSDYEKIIAVNLTSSFWVGYNIISFRLKNYLFGKSNR